MKENPSGIHEMVGFVIVKDMEREMTEIYAEFYDQQEDQRSKVKELKGNIAKKSITSLIDL